MSSDQNTGWLVDIGGYTAQLYGHYNKPWNKDPYKAISIMERQPRALNAAQVGVSKWEPIL